MVSGAQQIRKMAAYSVAAFAALLGLSWYFQPPTSRVPDDLIGTYHTSDEKYAERGLEIDSVSINFATGEGKVTVGIVDSVKVRLDSGKMLYTITYTSDEASNQVSFYYEPGKDQIIRFKNQERIAWTKDKPTSL
jgi:hypothetical protein